jgi:hypothetical protein
VILGKAQTVTYSTKLYLNNAPRMAHLLTIPREIRDLIYGYLTQERNFYLERERCYYGSKEVDVQVKNAPLLSVLLSHSRLKEEYMESTAFKRLSITLRMSPVYPGPDEPRDPSSFLGWDTALKQAYSRMLEHVTQVTVFVNCGTADSWDIR